VPAELTCPYCAATSPRPATAGAWIDCSACDRSFAAATERSGAATSSTGSGSTPRAVAPSDVPLGWTGAASLAATVLFFVAVVGPLRGSYFGDLFGARGWVPYVIAWMSLWAATLLIAKTRILATQRRAFDLDLLPESIAARITPDNARVFMSHLRHAAAPIAPSFLADRLDRALETFQLRRNVRDVNEQLATSASVDALAVESSYTMVRVFIWAIPILGFIGTVVGIGAAVSGFSTSVAAAVDLEVMKQSIGGVTSGLGVAFDTTLLALVMSILIMFPASSLQKAEEDFLGQVDDWCERQLARRLDDGHEDTLGGLRGEIARLASAIDSLQEHLTGNRPSD